MPFGKSGLAKRGMKGKSLDQLEKDLAEAFALLDTMGLSKNVRNDILTNVFQDNIRTILWNADEEDATLQACAGQEGDARLELGPARAGPCGGICPSGHNGSIKGGKKYF